MCAVDYRGYPSHNDVLNLMLSRCPKNVLNSTYKLILSLFSTSGFRCGSFRLPKSFTGSDVGGQKLGMDGLP